VVIAFLIAQACDGIFTYIGVASYGSHAEANPVMLWLMGALGSAGGVAAAKTAAGAFGIALHLVSVHRVVALLAAFYLVAAVLPWIGVLYF
jgi:hypothetical protein